MAPTDGRVAADNHCRAGTLYVGAESVDARHGGGGRKVKEPTNNGSGENNCSSMLPMLKWIVCQPFVGC